MQPNQRILIVEDEVAIRTGLIDVFVYHGFTVEYAEDGEIGLQKALTGQFDLILLDVMMPKLDGYQVLEKIREKDQQQAIIMLTAKTSDEDIIQGLSLGADDYVAKPFSIAQLILRVQAVLRRIAPAELENQIIRLSATKQIDFQNLLLKTNEKEILFTKREIEVIKYLYLNSDRPVAREELLSKVWGYAENLALETRTVDIHIAKIRKKIETDPKAPSILLTIRGAGYKLITDDSGQA